MALLSKMKIGSTVYELKDAQARANITTLLGEHNLEALGAAAWKAVASTISENGLVDAATVKSYVDAQVGAIHNFDVKIYEELPEASAKTMYIIGLVADEQASAGSYIEYITINNEGTYAWEKIGSTKTDLTGYVSKDTTIASIKLDHNVTAEELKTALGLGALAYKDSATGTVAGQTITGLKASGTTAGALTGEMAYTTTAMASTGNFTPDGSVTVTPASGIVKAVKSTGTAAAFTEGAFTPASLTKSDASFATAGVTVAIDEDDEETLVITPAATAQASLISAFSGGAKEADKFIPNEIAATEDVSVVTGIANAVFTGTEGAVSVSGNYDKANLGTVAFEGAAAEFTVDDVVVASKDVTVGMKQ